MKKNLFQIIIVFVTILVLSTTVMARGKKHDKWWWNPHKTLWSAIESLQEQMSKINEDIEEKLNGFAEPASSNTFSSTNFDSVVVPIVCPGCWFSSGRPDDGMLARMKGAYLSGSGMENMDLSRADLSGTDLRGAQMNNTNLSGAILYDADLSPKPVGATGEYETNLTGANLSDADLTGVKGLNKVTWSNTTCPDGSNTDTNGDDTCEGH
jgi:hypothetical protein